MEKPKPEKKMKKLTLQDLEQVVGGAARIKIEVESVPPTTKATGEG